MFTWQTKKKGWYLYTGEYPTGWEKKVKVVSLLQLVKKGLSSKSANLKSTKKGKGVTVGAFETCFDIVPSRGDFSPIGSIVLECTAPLSTRTPSTWKFAMAKSKPPLSRQPLNAPSI